MAMTYTNEGPTNDCDAVGGLSATTTTMEGASEEQEVFRKYLSSLTELSVLSGWK